MNAAEALAVAYVPQDKASKRSCYAWKRADGGLLECEMEDMGLRVVGFGYTEEQARANARAEARAAWDARVAARKPSAKSKHAEPKTTFFGRLVKRLRAIFTPAVVEIEEAPAVVTQGPPLYGRITMDQAYRFAREGHAMSPTNPWDGEGGLWERTLKAQETGQHGRIELQEDAD